MSEKLTGDSNTDRAVFERLYEQVHEPLVASLTGMVRDTDRAADIAASAFGTAWEKRAQFRGESSRGTGVHAIARNTARHRWRQERTSRLDSVDRLETPRYAEPDRLLAQLEQNELRDRIREALDRLPAMYRRTLVARYIDGRSVQEIARREGVPVGTIGSRLFTARRLLRETWPTTAAQTPKRDMPGEKTQQIADEALKRLSEELQAGRSATLTAYLTAMGRFHRYSWNNVMLINSQRPTATRVAGFHAWHDLGRFVKRGEKGIAILAPIRAKSRELAAPADRGESESTSRVVGFRTAYVFDIEQTEGRPLPQFATTTGDPREFLDRLKAVVAERNIAVEYDRGIAPAQGESSGGRIRLLPDMAPAEEFSVLTHEFAHELLHHRGDVALPKTVRETQAEAVAFVVSRGVGLETNTAAADYIALYNGDAKTLGESLAVIQHTASGILRELLPDEREHAAPEHTPGAHALHASELHPMQEPASDSARPVAPPTPERGDSASWDR
jgi:RNA polymerase sigma factor (sigma-70 family)